jgi:putative MFS transporter
VLVSAVSSMLLTFAPNYVTMLILEIFLGFGIGGEVALGGTVYSEFCPPSKAWTLTLLASCWCLGGTISALIALCINLLDLGMMELWRWLFATSMVLEYVFLVIRMFIDESPKFLMSLGKQQEVSSILRKVWFNKRSLSKTDKRRQVSKLRSSTLPMGINL